MNLPTHLKRLLADRSFVSNGIQFLPVIMAVLFKLDAATIAKILVPLQALLMSIDCALAPQSDAPTDAPTGPPAIPPNGAKP